MPSGVSDLATMGAKGARGDTVSVPDLTVNRALHREVESYVIELIRNGELRPGDRVNEAEIARRLQISRTPVREAFTRLIKDGVLDHIPRRGVFVARLSRESQEEIASLRVVIEGFAARWACQRMAPDEFARLRRIVDEGAQAGLRGDWLAMEEKNAEFHDVLIGGAHHSLLRRVWCLLSPMTWKLIPGARPESVDSATVEDFVRRHLALIEAVASGDPDRAEQAAMTHVRRAAAHTLTDNRHVLDAPAAAGERRAGDRRVTRELRDAK
jgi:DNA-binding GntR family transcriptional regulator